MSETIDLNSKHKCAHAPCLCQIASSEKYCGSYCAEADQVKDIEIECDCKHSVCELD